MTDAMVRYFVHTPLVHTPLVHTPLVRCNALCIFLQTLTVGQYFQKVSDDFEQAWHNNREEAVAVLSENPLACDMGFDANPERLKDGVIMYLTEFSSTILPSNIWLLFDDVFCAIGGGAFRPASDAMHMLRDWERTGLSTERVDMCQYFASLHVSDAEKARLFPRDDFFILMQGDKHARRVAGAYRTLHAERPGFVFLNDTNVDVLDGSKPVETLTFAAAADAFDAFADSMDAFRAQPFVGVA